MDEKPDTRRKIVAFVCNWCSYAAADAAGTARLQYDESVRIIRLPCTGRADPLFIVKAFEQGADGVLVSGCHPGDCHYVTGNLHARRRFFVFKKLMEFLGLDERRLQFSWVSAAEGNKWAAVVNAVSEGVKQLSADERLWGRPGAAASKETAATAPPPQPRPGGGFEERMTAQLRALARRLLENKQVGVVIGYAQGSLPQTTTPFFALKPDDSEQLLWNRHCLNNLSVYLTRPLVRKLGRMAVVVKGCDARAIIGLIQEHQLRREELFIIGVACDGVLEGGALAGKCRACSVRRPPLYDELIGEPSTEKPDGVDPLEQQLSQIENMPRQQRWDYWQQQFARCTRCYACRAVCPFCYCETCIAEKHRPQWIAPSAHGAGNLAWNIFRAMHLAGRCIDCRECARVCPAGIRLDLINKKLATEIKSAFGYEAGVCAEAAPALTTYRPDDAEEFIR